MKETFKVLFTIEVDTETNESKVIKKEMITDEAPKKKTATEKKKEEEEESSEPQLTLTDNKYLLNKAALTALKADTDARIDIKYHKVEGALVPIIGLDETFGTHSGNRLTKTGTVSCRGNANTQLSRYGTIFTFKDYKDGLFLLSGDKDIIEEEEKEVPHDVNLNLEGLVDEVEKEDDEELTNFDFNL